jgi:DnaJ-class molecular chaperone
MARIDENTPLETIRQALETLELPQMVTREEIKRQYRHLAKKHHPDRGGDAETMRRIAEAYAILTEYIDNFRFRFDEEEIAKQYPGADYAQRFKP